MKISLIAAVAANGVIGKGNKLLWRYPKDMRRFKSLTKQSGVIVMGRKTHESLGRLLPDRVNLVLSRDRSYQSPYGALVLHDTKQMLLMLDYFYGNDDREIMVIGGEQIYREFLPHASKLYITNINAPFDGDTYFPEISGLEWRSLSEEHHYADDKHQFPFSFDTLERIQA